MGSVKDRWIRAHEPTAAEESRMPTGMTEDGERLPACPSCGSIYFYDIETGECNACGLGRADADDV